MEMQIQPRCSEPDLSCPLPPVQLKIVIVGQALSGKTSLMVRFVKNSFTPNNEYTVGLSFLTKTVYIHNTKIKFELWDTAGSERYRRSVAPMYYRGSHAAVVVYDITNFESYVYAKTWVYELRAKVSPKLVIVLAGCKSDLEYRREVCYQGAERYAREQNLIFLETSALTSDNVCEVFREIGLRFPKDPETEVQQSFRIIRPDPNQNQPRRCCPN